MVLNHTVAAASAPAPILLSGGIHSSALVGFLALQLLGAHFMLPVLVLTFLCTRARRHPALLNLCLAFIICGVVTSLLFYGGQYKVGGPDRGICLAQASLSYAIAPMGAAATLCLLYHVWSSIHATTTGEKPNPRWSSLRSLAVVYTPWIVFVAYSIGGIIVALSDPKRVTLSPDVIFFCTLPPGPYATSTSIGTAGFLVWAMYFEVRTIILLIRNMRAAKNGGEGVKTDLALVNRVVIFGGYIALGFIFTLVTIVKASLVPDMYAATLPVLIALLFGSQSDVLEAWGELLHFRRRPEEKPVEGVAAYMA